MYDKTLATIRSILFAVILLGLIGTGFELILVGHFESTAQWIPLVLISVAIVVLAGYGLFGGGALLRLFQAVMIMFVVAGGAGILLHYKGNVDFEHRTSPTMSGTELFRKAIAGTTPILAPGTMIEFGILGLAYVFRHPALSEESKDEEDSYITIGE